MERTVLSRQTVADGPAGRRAEVAYVKVVEQDGEFAYAVFEEDGSLVGIAPTRGLAFVAARQYDLAPQDAH